MYLLSPGKCNSLWWIKSHQFPGGHWSLVFYWAGQVLLSFIYGSNSNLTKCLVGHIFTFHDLTVWSGRILWIEGILEGLLKNTRYFLESESMANVSHMYPCYLRMCIKIRMHNLVGCCIVNADARLHTWWPRFTFDEKVLVFGVRSPRQSILGLLGLGHPNKWFNQRSRCHPKKGWQWRRITGVSSPEVTVLLCYTASSVT